VCKGNTTSGGEHVYRVQNQMQLETAVHQLFKSFRSLCLVPYVDILNEYRVIVHQAQVRLIYAKHRPFVLGNGQDHLYTLALEKYGPIPWAPELELNWIPEIGKRVLLNWKHNLSHGAQAKLLKDQALQNILNPLALQTVQALGLHLAAVDIAETSQGHKVLEV